MVVALHTRLNMTAGRRGRRMGYTSTRLEVNVVCGAVPPTPATRRHYPDWLGGNGPRPILGRL